MCVVGENKCFHGQEVVPDFKENITCLHNHTKCGLAVLQQPIKIISCTKSQVNITIIFFVSGGGGGS